MTSLARCWRCQSLGRASSPARVVRRMAARRLPEPPDALAVRLVDQLQARHAVTAARLPAHEAATAPRSGDSTASRAEPAPKDFAATRGWEGGTGIPGSRSRDGQLTGRTTTDFPILQDRADRGARQSRSVPRHRDSTCARRPARTSRSLPRARSGRFRQRGRARPAARPGTSRSPLVAGDEIQTYTLTSPGPAEHVAHPATADPADRRGRRHVRDRIGPPDQPARASRSVPSGVGWQGLSEIYRETLVARAPETMTFDVTLPERPWLDLGGRHTRRSAGDVPRRRLRRERPNRATCCSSTR